MLSCSCLTDRLLSLTPLLSARIFTKEWDVNGDGTLDVHEFKNALDGLGIKLREEHALNDLFMILDEDQSGSVSLYELQNSLRWVRSCEVCQSMRSQAYAFEGTLSIKQQIRRVLAANAVKVMDLFREWDTNNDGNLSRSEFRRAMPLLGIHADAKELDELFAELDGDGDGVATFREFNRAMRRETDRNARDALKDAFGQPVEPGEWRPSTPPVMVLELNSLRRNVRMEYRLRKLDSVPLFEDPLAGLREAGGFEHEGSPMGSPEKERAAGAEAPWVAAGGLDYHSEVAKGSATKAPPGLPSLGWHTYEHVLDKHD